MNTLRSTLASLSTVGRPRRSARQITIEAGNRHSSTYSADTMLNTLGMANR